MTLDNVKCIIVVLKKPYCSCHQHYCPPPFRRKMEGHCFPFSVVRGSGFLLDALSLQLLLQLKADPFETLQVLLDGLKMRICFFSEP